MITQNLPRLMLEKYTDYTEEMKMHLIRGDEGEVKNCRERDRIEPMY